MRKKHATVDTLARKFWILNNSVATHDLLRLKAVLVCFFLYETSRFPSDKRYDSFFASILGRSGPGKPLFPESISILSWNYDLLLEKSYYEFSADLEVVQEHITEKVIRLNGIAAARNVTSGAPKKAEYVLDIGINDLIILFSYFFKNKDQREIKFRPEIKFAWENSGILKRASTVTTGTEILVVIGYSFPFFNQDIDKALLKQMEHSLKKIYLQTKGDVGGHERLLNLLHDVQYPDGTVRNRWEEHVEMIDGTDYFYIPNEFTGEGSS